MWIYIYGCIEHFSKRTNYDFEQEMYKMYLLNACNLEVLHLWGSNIDPQYVINVIAAVMYVCSYIIKGEKVMGETLKRVVKECCTVMIFIHR